MSVGCCYLIEALLGFFKIENVNDVPLANNLFLSQDISDEAKKRTLINSTAEVC